MHSLHEYVKKAVRFPKLAPRFPNPNLKKNTAHTHIYIYDVQCFKAV